MCKNFGRAATVILSSLMLCGPALSRQFGADSKRSEEPGEEHKDEMGTARASDTGLDNRRPDNPPKNTPPPIMHRVPDSFGWQDHVEVTKES